MIIFYCKSTSAASLILMLSNWIYYCLYCSWASRSSWWAVPSTNKSPWFEFELSAPKLFTMEAFAVSIAKSAYCIYLSLIFCPISTNFFAKLFLLLLNAVYWSFLVLICAWGTYSSLKSSTSVLHVFSIAPVYASSDWTCLLNPALSTSVPICLCRSSNPLIFYWIFFSWVSMTLVYLFTFTPKSGLAAFSS